MSQKQTALITGGAGFIGSHVAARLIAEGYDVSVLDNLSSGNIDNLPPEAEFYEGDILYDSAQVFRLVKPDFLFHYAAQINVRASEQDPINDAEQNIISSLRLLDLCKKHCTEKVIFPSSSSVYGNASHIPTKESDLIAPLSPYGIAKSTIERYLCFYSQAHDLDHTALRFSNVYGPRQNPRGEAGVISVFLNQMLKGKQPCIWGDGTQTRDFVYVEDVAEANVKALQYDGQQHVFNISTGSETTLIDLYKAIQIVFTSLFPDHDPITPGYNQDFHEKIPRIRLDPSLALHEMHWEADTVLEEGLEKTIHWFQDHHQR